MGNGGTQVLGGHVQGNLFHVDMTLSQFGPWRPTPSLAGYKMPIPGLWHTGAGAHPLTTRNGWSGRTAARQIPRAGKA